MTTVPPRKLGLSLLLASAALAAVLLLWGRRHAPRSVPGPSEPVGEEQREPLHEPALAAPAQRSTAPSEGGTVEPAPVSAASAPEREERSEGVLLVFDERERLHAELDGSFLLTAEDEDDEDDEAANEDDDDDEGRTIEVRGGRFAAELRSGARYFVENVQAGGRPAVPLESQHPHRNAEGGWELTARWARATVLTVVAADSGLELAGLDLLQDAGSDGGCRPVALEEATWLARDARSPITLPLPEDAGVWAGTRTLHARAPGYAWGCVSVPDSLGGEFRLALERGGSLEIRVVGQDASVAEAFLRLRRAGREDGHPGHAERLGERATVVLEALEAATWVVTLELGHRWRWPRVLARGEVAVPQGGHASLELRVWPVEDPGLVVLGGQVRASRAWGFRALDLTAELLDEPPRGSALRFLRLALSAPRAEAEGPAEEPAVWEWRLADVQPGRWSLDLPRLGLGLAVDVPLQGRSDVELVVPDPVEVSVEVRERGSDLPVPDARLSWMPPRPWTDVGGVLLASEAVAPGRFHFRAPAGPVELWCFSERHRFVHEELALFPPRTEHVVHLEPACGFALRVRHETTVLPWPISFGYGLEARRLDGEGRAFLSAQDENQLEARFTATAPGRYRLELPSVPGYAPIAPQEILVPPEGFVRHDVELAPR